LSFAPPTPNQSRAIHPSRGSSLPAGSRPRSCVALRCFITETSSRPRRVDICAGRSEWSLLLDLSVLRPLVRLIACFTPRRGRTDEDTTVILAALAGAGIGGLAVQGLHAQTKLPVASTSCAARTSSGSREPLRSGS